MRKLKLLLGASALTLNIIAQQNPTSNSPANQNQNGTNDRAFWSRAGNTSANGLNNIFGTTGGWNSPIYTVTNGVTRMQMNGTVSNVINVGTSLSRDGFIGIGNPTGFYNGNGGGQGPFSLLHLNGINAAGTPQSLGYRDWMRFGITSTHNQDLMYIGQRATGGSDVTDVVIGWADNFGAPSAVGPDNMTFNFLTGAGQGGNDDLVGTSTNGREIMRLTAIGNIGVGPRFNNTWQPQSTLHQHQENATSSWMQISNQYMTQAAAGQTGPTAINATNGFRFGILGNTIKAKNGNAYVYNQEERHLIFSTNHATPTDAQFTNERMRITSISAPTNLTNVGNSTFGIWNPGALTNQDVTRVAISHNPATPVTRPLALLHLGYNSGSILNPTTTDGWRSWMDVGTYVARGSDNMYIGLKPEGNAASLGDRQDAVISWGDNYSNTNIFNVAPDKLRIIFTSPAAGQPSPGPGAMSSQDGLEFVRYVPFHNTALAINDPRTGFGDFQNLTPIGTINPGNTIEINSILGGYNLQHDSVTGSYFGGTGASGLRFRDLTSLSIAIPDSIADSLKIDRKKVLTVDSLGNVVLVNNNGGNGVGNYCGATSNPLTAHYEIPLATYNYRFSGQQDFTSNVGIGIACNQGIYAKLHVVQYKNKLNSVFNNQYASVTGRFDNYSANNTTDAYGIIGSATSTGAYGYFGAYGIANGALGSNYGVFSQGDLYTTGGANTIGGYVSGSDKNIKTNVARMSSNLEIITRLKPVSFKFDNAYAPQLKLNSTKNYGFIAQDVAEVLPDLIVTSTVAPTYDSTGQITNPAKELKSLNYDGLIPFAIGGIQELNARQKEMQAAFDKSGLSDAQVKTNVNTFNALATVKALSPVKYNFTNANVPQLNFKPNTDYGFIAQQLETVYPELVDTIRVDATYDSLGVIVNPSKVLKTVNYKAMSALLVRSIQEQQLTIDSLRNAHSKQDSINNAVQQQLAALAAQINSCCSNTNTSRQSNSNINQLDIELSDKDAIVLNQNVPNPFAEQTTITYNVPASVGKAQIIFYNNVGQIIQTVDVKTRGKGKVNVFASDLSSGLYHYTLVADGKVVDSKKMVRE